ncbi:hypothetical protein COCSADRAFT_345966 [Bipolaris sorokiniana ND90Pr]|uniref:Rhodopsin domain-containing protein n=1 Tax=Cochliobolus sativus (strain ND90Pr / ATCC 201652) TaxID=665912 RepID=M2SV25_COCSN|nr:uncharacterized protein COCSADRAFT_345966 [Bipolaris sorokiniana ND90Pr]EMD60667.1 hypothetical protein COCSADRAFT_345966 [Bipolaris sorokiniana ND90Pr]
MTNATDRPAPTSEPIALGPDHSATYLVPFSVLMAIVIISTMARIYSRIRPQWRLAWDDYTLIFAFTLTATWFSLLVSDDIKGGRVIENYPRDPSFSGPIETAAGLIFFWALNFIRISMCLMLHRLKYERAWKLVLRSLIIVQVCLIILATCVQMVLCRPLSALWTPTPEARCIPIVVFKYYWIIHYSFHIFIDLMISLMPVTFIYGMHRSLYEKILLCGLMGAGLAATAAAFIFLIVLIKCFGVCYNALWNFRLDICTTLQLFLGVIAANLPYLKAPVHNILIQWGIIRPVRHPPSGVSPETFRRWRTHGCHFAQQLHDIAISSFGDSKQASHIVTQSSLDDSQLLEQGIRHI